MDRPEYRDWSGDAAQDNPSSDPPPIRLDYIPPPDDLQPLVTTFYLFRCDDRRIRDIQPAATGQLQVYLRGEGVMAFPSGGQDRSHPETVMAPLTAAAKFDVDGPFHAVGAVLSPLGWAALTGLDAAKAANRLYDGCELFGPPMRALGDALRAEYEAEPATDGVRLAERLADFIRTRAKPVPGRHVQLIAQTVEWLGTALSPPVERLYSASDYSPRQIQRLVARYFGSSPAHLLRKYRAARVVALLTDPGTSDATVASLVDEFYDQSHMIREIREFTGRTPARLTDDDAPILKALVDVRNFREIRPNVAPLPNLESQADDA